MASIVKINRLLSVCFTEKKKKIPLYVLNDDLQKL